MEVPLTRRRLLAVGGVTALAGCLARESEESTEEAPEPDLEGVGAASIANDRLQVAVGEGVSKFAVLDAIDDVSRVQDFSVVESSLEDLFVRYTTESQEVEA